MMQLTCSLTIALICSFCLGCGAGSDSSDAREVGVQEFSTQLHTQLAGGEGLAGFANLVKSAEINKAIKGLKKDADRFTRTDPARAVEALVKLSNLVGAGAGPIRQLRESKIEGLQATRQHHADPQLLMKLGRELFLVGRFEEADEAFSAWQAHGDSSSAEAVEVMCWRSACASTAGRTQASEELIADAEQALAARGSKAAAPGWNVPRPRTSAWNPRSIDGLPVMASDGLTDVSYPGGIGMSGSILESPNSLRALEQRRLAQRSNELSRLQSAQQEFDSAEAAWKGEQDRYEAESSHYYGRAGRNAVLGVDLNEVGPTQPDPQAQLRYLQARSALEQAQRGTGN